jgi:hypothetical protein
VLTIVDRKITHWRDYLDPVAVFGALGWLDPSEVAGDLAGGTGREVGHPGRHGAAQRQCADDGDGAAVDIAVSKTRR